MDAKHLPGLGSRVYVSSDGACYGVVVVAHTIPTHQPGPRFRYAIAFEHAEGVRHTDYEAETAVEEWDDQLLATLLERAGTGVRQAGRAGWNG